MEKSELDPKQVFDFIGYQFDLKEGKVRPTLDLWQSLTTKILAGPTCLVRQFMSLIGLLTATAKQVSSGSTPYETHTVAPEKPLEGSRVTRKGDTSSQVAPPSTEMVAGEKDMCFKVNHYTH